MDSLRYCSNQGCLVGESNWIPDAIFDYENNHGGSIVGCNQVFCHECNEYVKQRRGFSFKSYSRDDLRRWAPILFKTENWDKLPFVHKDYGRVYFCSCHSLPTTNTISLDGSDNHLIYGAQHPESWKCGGHPPLILPTEIYGVALKGIEDFKEVVASLMEHRAFIHDPVPSDEINPEAFLISRLYALLETETDRKPLDDLLAEFLTHKDPLYRSVGCVLIKEFPRSNAAPRLISSYRNNAQLFDGVPHPYHSRGLTPIMRIRLIGLDEQFQNALMAYLKTTQSPEARTLIRELILNGKIKTIWGSAESEVGSDWVDDHLFEIFSHDPKKSLYSLIPYGVMGKSPRILDRARKLLEMKILPEEEIMEELPALVRAELQPNPPHVSNPKSRKK